MLLDALRLDNPGLHLFDIRDREFSRCGTPPPGFLARIGYPSGFWTAVMLPSGSSEEFRAGQAPGTRRGGDSTLRKGNKWIIAHPERRVFVDDRVFPGIRGPNVEIIPVDADP